MQKLRKQIDEIDQKIIKLLAKRMDVVKKIGQFKKEAGISVKDKNREQELKNELKRIAGKDLSPDFVDRLYDVIFKECRKVQDL